MNVPRATLDHLESVLANSGLGVVGLVDELVAASFENDLRLGWQSGCCSLSFPGCESSDRIEVPLRKSVVRAALARIAALCNERSPDSVSPYGGQGEIAIDTDPSRAIRATFVNTHETVTLELSPAASQVASLVVLSGIKSPD
jgi:hypothetical protein